MMKNAMTLNKLGLVILLSLLSQACGQTGGLYLPAKNPEPVPATKPAE